MIKIIPAILVDSFDQAKERINSVQSLVSTVQIDVMDGVFVPNTSYGDPDKLAVLLKDLEYEVHLMVANPQDYVWPWAKAGAEKIIFHAEEVQELESVIDEAKKNDVKVGIAINPATPVERIEMVLDKIDSVTIMGVDPGFSGQQFQPLVLDKIKLLRTMRPKLEIEVDGGVDQNNIAELVKVGVNSFAAASSIFKNNKPELAIAQLKEAAK